MSMPKWWYLCCGIGLLITTSTFGQMLPRVEKEEVEYEDGETIVLPQDQFALFARNLEMLPISVNKAEVKVIQIVDGDGRIAYIVNQADDYRDLPLRLPDGTRLTEVESKKIIRVAHNPECEIRKIGNKFKIHPPGCVP